MAPPNQIFLYSARDRDSMDLISFEITYDRTNDTYTLTIAPASGEPVPRLGRIVKSFEDYADEVFMLPPQVYNDHYEWFLHAEGRDGFDMLEELADGIKDHVEKQGSFYHNGVKHVYDTWSDYDNDSEAIL